MGPSNLKHQSFYRQVFQIDNTDSTTATALTMTFTDPSIRTYGLSNVGSISYTWPYDSSSVGVQSKVSFKINGGFAATWLNTSVISFLDSTAGTYNLLWVNNKLNKFVFQMPQKTAIATVMNISGLQNPYPYQQSDYNNVTTIQANFYKTYILVNYKTFAQTAYSVFTKNLAIVGIDQNLPSNSLNTYPVANKIGSGALSVLRLGVVISQTSANIIARKLQTLDIQFTAGVSYLQECRVMRNSSLYVNPKSVCQTYLSTNWHVIIYHFTQSQVDVFWWLQVLGKFSSATVSYTATLYASNGVAEYASTYSVSLATYYSSAKTIPTTLSWLNRKYIRTFFQNQHRYLQAVSGQTTPYFRTRFTITHAFDGSGDYVKIWMNSPSVFVSQTSSANLICQILPAVSAERDFSIGYYGECLRGDVGNGNQYYYMTGPIGGWIVGDYMLQISQPNVITTKFSAATAPGFLTVQLQAYGDGLDYWDAMDYYFKQYFTSVQILHTTTTVSDYDTLAITYTPKTSVAAGGTSNEVVLSLDVSGLYHLYDGGIVSVYSADGVTVNSGARYSQVVSSPSGNQASTVLFSQYSQKMAPLRFSLGRMSALTAGTSYTWRLPLIKNPSTAYIALRYNLTLTSYASGSNVGVIVNQHQCINQYYTESDTSVSFSPSVTNNNRYVQVVSGVDLSINLNSYSLAQWDSVMFKLDNSYAGLSTPSFSAGNDTTNYNYYYFHDFNMIWAQKKSVNTISSVGIGASSSSLNYARDFKFAWVKVHDSSNVATTANPRTLRYGYPSSLTLNYLTTYSAATLTKVQGVQNQGSAVMYKLDITVPIIPLGGQIQLVFDSTKISSNSNAHCRVRTNFVKSTTDSQILRCFRMTGGFRITGFTAVTAGTSLSIYFMVKSITALSAQNIAVNIYGIFDDSTSSIAKKNAVTITHASSTFPATLYRNQEVRTVLNTQYPITNTPYSFYSFEGNLNLRAVNLVSGDFIKIIFPLTSFDLVRFIIKRNDSNYVEWTQLTPALVSGTTYTFTIPTGYLIDLTLTTGVQYIWKCTTIVDSYTYNPGFSLAYQGTSKFWYVANHSVQVQTQYYDLVTQPLPSVLTIANRYPAANRKTVLDFSITLNADVYSGDWIQLTFDTHNLIRQMFPNDIQDSVTSGQTYRYLDCREASTTSYISYSRIKCIMIYGDSSTSPPRPARLVIPISITTYFASTPGVIRFLVSNVRNPPTSGMNVGVQMNIFRGCANNVNKNCSVSAARGFYVTKTTTQNLQTTTSSFTPSTSIVLDNNITHTFKIVTTASVTTSDVIYIVYPQNFVGMMPSTCSASYYTCYAFPTSRWIMLIPTTTVISAAGTLTIALTTYMSNGYYSQPASLYFKVTVSRGSGTSTADTYNILQSPLTTIKRSTSSNISTSMTITPTQTPNIWLRNYANTAIFLLDNIFMDARIQSIYIKAPTDVLLWDASYCNASLIGTINNTYPLRFTCNVVSNDSTILQIVPQSQDLGSYSTYANVWDDLTVQVHAKFTIADFTTTPTLYTTTPVTSGTFNAYGSVSATSTQAKYFMSQCSQTISISQHQVPIISDIQFDQDSFAYRVARVNKKQVFYLLLKPTLATSTITQMIFTIPVEFDYPGIFTHDNCFMIGRTKQDQDICKQSREGGQTLIKLTPQNYDNQVKIIQLGSLSEINWFTAPSLPGNFYNMTVQLYGANSVLLQKQTINISPIYGQDFDIPSIVLHNILDGSIAQSVYDLTFVTGTLQIPPGAKTTATTMTSQLQFIFQNYNANDATNVFKNDLGTGLSEGSQVGCIIISGIVALENMRLTCTLHIGTNSTDKPRITILNYNYINPGTTIQLSFGGIQSLNQVNVNTISMAVVVHYTTINSYTYLYMPTARLPDPTNNTLALTDYNTLYYDWNTNWYFECGFYNNNIVRQPTNLYLRVRTPYSYPFYYTYASTGVTGDFILLKFLPKFVIDPYNPLTISCPLCTSVQVFYSTGIVRIRQTQSISGWWGTNFTFTNFPSSAYTITNQTVKVNVQVYKAYRLFAYSNLTTVAVRSVQKCSLFTFGVLSVSSINGGEIGVTYTFSLITNHYIPANGAISITIPSAYGNMVTNGVTCTLVGFSSTNVYCLIQTPSRVDLYMNGTELPKTTSYKILLSGLQNPNQDSSSLIFYVTSYYNSNIYLGYKICENSVIPPAITVKAVRTCTLSWSASFVNKNYNATHTFVVSCNDLFRGDSILYIKLPSDFSSNNTDSSIYCSSLESTTLATQNCNLTYINGSFMLWTRLQATSQTSLSIVVNLVNPTNNTYSALATVLSKQVTYAQTASSYLTILSNSYVSASASAAFLMNSPKQAGLMATYIFKISPMTTFTPTNLAITFPDNFNIAASQLIVGVAATTNSRLFSSLNYDNVQKIINNVSAVDSVSLQVYPNFTVQTNTVLMPGLSSYLSNSSWTYVFIRGIKNPAEYLAKNFTLAYYIDSVSYRTLQWRLSAPLTYYISSPPAYLSINSVNVSDYDLLYPSVYTFKFSTPNSNPIAIQNKKLSYVVVIPNFYKSTMSSNSNITCKFAQLSTTSTCVNYQSQVIVTETFTSNYTTLTLSITTLLNPSLQTYCSTTDVTLLEQTFFRIRIIEVQSNKFMFQSSAVVDGSNCLKFYSIRIPISLEHSLVMVAGLAYNITYGITKPASNLKIRASTISSGFTFLPNTVVFNDYYTLKQVATVYLRSDISPGNYTITFQKFESETKTYFRNILPTTVQVLAPSSSSYTKPTISIPSMTVSTVGYPVVVPIQFSLPSSTQMTLFIKISEQANQTLSEYSPSLSNFSLEPRIINILPQSTNFSFTIIQGQQVVPPPLTLTFTLSSVYTIIHNLTTPTMTICFDRDPTYNVLYPPLRIKLTQFPSSCNKADIGKKVTNIMVSNSTQKSSAASVVPQIIAMTPSNIKSSQATLTINTRTSGTIYYLCIDSGYPAITSTAQIVALNNTYGFVGTATSSAQNVYTGSTAQVNYLSTFQINKLSSSTSYVVYAVLSSQLGTSAIKSTSFSTIQLSKGVLMKLTFNAIVASLDIVKSLQRIIRISPLRIKVLTSPYSLQLISSNTNQYKNNPKYVYEVVIAPDPTNDTVAPLTIVQNFLNSSTSTGLFSSYLSDWDSTATVKYYELRPVKPRVAVMPAPKVINLYNATFTMKFWERANVYAILVLDTGKAEDSMSVTQKQITSIRVSALSASEQALSPSSLQVRYGRNIDNTNTTVYNKFSAMTDEKGNANIFFDDLKPGSIYKVYITSSSYLPYEPTLLWENSQVIRMQFETLYNPNLMKSNRHIEELKKYQPGLGDAIDRFIKNQEKKNQKASTSQK